MMKNDKKKHLMARENGNAEQERAARRATESARWKRLCLYIMAAVCLFSPAATALGFGLTECAPSRKGSDLGCTAGDVSITGIAIATGGPSSCIGGSGINVDLDVTVNFAVPDRWDIGIFLVNDGKNPQLLPANGGAASCSVAVLPTSSPFLNLDPGPWGGTLDTCGDGNGSINGGTGSGVVRITNVPVSCRAISLSGGNLYIPFVVSWDNQSSPSGATCTSNLDPVPNTVSKCNSPKTTVAAEVAYGTVNLVVLPAITKTDGIAAITAGDSVNYTVVITNTTGVALSGAVFKDPAVTNLTANSVSCTAAGGATCPVSPTVAAMQGAGITIPAMPANSSVTFTVNATLSSDAPAGTLTNTATVTVSGQANSASDSDTVLAKLGVTKAFAPFSILVGVTSVMSITLQNPNPAATAGTAFTDAYPANLVNASAPGVTNTCGGTVTATAGGNSLSLSGGIIPANGSCVVTVKVTSATSGFYTNSTGNVTTTNGYSGNAATGYLAVGVSSLLSSTKTWQDTNGGDQDPGDVIRYTMAITEIAGVDATGVTVTDTIPATLTGMMVVTCPAGATCNVAGQTLTVTNVTVPAYGSVVIAFDVTLAAGTPAGTLISNCATITNPGGGGAAPCATTITVSASSIPAAGNKPLYLYDGASTPAYKTSRAKPSGVPASVTINKGTSRLWTQSPALASSVSVGTAGVSIPVSLYLAANIANASRIVQVDLACSGGGTIFTQTQTITLNTAPDLRTFNLPITANQSCATGQTWNLTVFNNSGNGEDVIVYPVSGGNYSNVSLPTQNVINVDSVNSYNAAYPSVTTPASGYYSCGQTVHVRAVVSDPFGSYDITSATVTIQDPNNNTVISNIAMTEPAGSSTAATKTYEYAYAIPVACSSGWWKTTVTAKEGTENTVSDSGVGSFQVQMPSLLVMKYSTVISDPISGVSPTARAIPGAVVQYAVQVTNQGVGVADANSIAITDAIPANMVMYADTTGNAVTYVCSSAPACGMGVWDGATAVKYSNVSGAGPFTYTPSGAGYDSAIKGVQITPAGTLNGSNAYFTVSFRVQIN